MDAQERLSSLYAWLQRTTAEARNDLSPSAARELKDDSPGVLLDYAAIAEIACQCRYFGEKPFNANWSVIRQHVEALSTWRSGLELEYVAANGRHLSVKRVQLADKLRSRLDTRIDEHWEVPMNLLSEFLQFSATTEIRSHFFELDLNFDSFAEPLTSLLPEPFQFAELLISSERSDLRTAAVQLNDALEFVIRRYRLVMSLAEWPVVQSSVILYLDDAGWPLQTRARFIDRCIDLMQNWPLHVDDAAMKERIQGHLSILKNATESMNQRVLETA